MALRPATTTVALHTEAERALSQNDASWQVSRLASPRTIDLAALTNGAVSALFSGKLLPAASYAQLRLFALPHDATLADAVMGLRIDGPIVVAANRTPISHRSGTSNERRALRRR